MKSTGVLCSRFSRPTRYHLLACSQLTQLVFSETISFMSCMDCPRCVHQSRVLAKYEADGGQDFGAAGLRLGCLVTQNKTMTEAARAIGYEVLSFTTNWANHQVGSTGPRKWHAQSRRRSWKIPRLSPTIRKRVVHCLLRIMHLLPRFSTIQV